MILFKEWQDPIIGDISKGNSMSGLIGLGKSHPAVGVGKGLLVNTANALDISGIIGVLGTDIRDARYQSLQRTPGAPFSDPGPSIAPW